MSMYYPTVDQIYNEGGLTLVSKAFIEWAKILVTTINLKINVENINRKKKTIMKEAASEILGNRSLYGKFKKAMVKLPGIGETEISRCHFNIVKKTLNARAGSVFKWYHDRLIGHYSKKLNVEFRKVLQVKAKSNKHKSVKKKETGDDEL